MPRTTTTKKKTVRRTTAPKETTTAAKKSATAKAAKATKKGGGAIIEIPAMNLAVMKLDLEGVTPLIMHKFSAKSQKQMADKQQGKAQNKRKAKDPKEEFEGAIYWLDKAKKKYGFPSSAFKQAAVGACRYVQGVTMTHVKGAFHVLGDMVEIKSRKKPAMREDTVRVGGFGKQVADLRYRPEFKDWKVQLEIRYNVNVITPEQIAHLFETAGFSVGVGDWRPEKNGQFGMFRVAGKPKKARKK